MSKLFPPETLARSFRDTALTVSMLADKDAPEHVEDWREHAAGLVRATREGLRQAGAREVLIERASYAQCALLDEAALRCLEGAKRAEWAREPLQVRFFNSYQAGEVLLGQMRAHLAQPAAEPALSWCYAMVLAMGFRGGEDDAASQALLGQLSALVPAPPPLTAGEFDGAVAMLRGGVSWRFRRMALPLAAAGAGLAATLLGYAALSWWLGVADAALALS
ncbi:DotU/TssL family secretion system protein [Chromobacterium haemolyticum]|uniref:DotU/TssL family secretion system protein n=1 Tax=Chromobacterium haemolyticum TaxID=394935 RepID=A0ABS3GSN1_9NEIS|nr:DotU/TssL family secretion system protein [Chromobacterium haemolyticum]MBK0416940.1 DotU family type IV/VI secretion system protein [Chromobacterium haemolyticum]MBO0418062.1 DotU/TssL family secretion system protein [Chromobacterium haemolyticum]MBO0501323.1 DotU/TssL family secretion system protein [Chromobacterium haemolyticum]OQS30938.1 hypothetical protein B0T40_24035 [Chromobacterium haemolyticum]PTU69625.1 DotU family type IV/VI secretion system protein [Chromobacterium haemolyticum